MRNNFFILISIVFVLSGCAASPPKSFKIQFETTPSLALSEKGSLLNLLVHAQHESKPFDPHRGGMYGAKSKLNGNTISYAGLNATFAHEFTVNSDGEIYRRDVSKRAHGNGTGEKAYCIFCDDFGFTSYINTFQSELSKRYHEYATKYAEMKQEYTNLETLFEEKYNRVNFSVVDKTNILPKEVLSELDNGVEKYKQIMPLKISAVLSDVPLDKYFNIVTKATVDKVNRYLVEYENPYLENAFNEQPLTSFVAISNVKFNYIPQTYSIYDESIRVEFDENIVSISNNTSYYITIESLSCYYYSDIETLNNMELKLPPRSKILQNLDSISFLKNKYVNVKKKDQKVNFGFAINYHNKDTNKRTSIYDTKDYYIESFELHQ